MHCSRVAFETIVALLYLCRQNGAQLLGGLDVFLVNMEYDWPGTNEWRSAAMMCLREIFSCGPKEEQCRFGMGCSKALLLYHDNPAVTREYYTPITRPNPIIMDTGLTECAAKDGENSVQKVLVMYKEIAKRDFRPNRSIVTIFLADQNLATDLENNEDALFFAKPPNELLVIVKADRLSEDALYNLALGYIEDNWIMPFSQNGCNNEFVEKFKKAVCMSVTEKLHRIGPCQMWTPAKCAKTHVHKSSLKRGDIICKDYLQISKEPCNCEEEYLERQDTDSQKSRSESVMIGLLIGGILLVLLLIVAIVVVFMVRRRKAVKNTGATKSSTVSMTKSGSASRQRSSQKSTSKRSKSAVSVGVSLTKSKTAKSQGAGSKMAKSDAIGSKQGSSKSVVTKV